MLDSSKNYAWIKNCPLCGQGRLMVAKEDGTENFYITCEECGSVWNSPDNPNTNNIIGNELTGNTIGQLTYLTREELGDHVWKGFLQD
ncbi:hypothetical protein IT396_00085 [Candidatus Nomurabacteria bacterium]|nr:hypothetical protein [Candidatus Nomurabacteria bacterium]